MVTGLNGMRRIAALLLILIPLAGAALSQEPAQEVETPKPLALADKVLGSFRLMKDGVGFLLLDGRMLVEVLVIHREFVEPGVFLLDTESDEACCLDESFAGKLHFETEGKISLKFGEHVAVADVTPEICTTNDLKKFSKKNAPVLQGRALSGVLGFPVLKGKKLVLDYTEYRLRFIDQEPEEGVEEGNFKGPLWEIPIRMKPANLSCDAVINGDKNAVFQISTACPASWIKREAAVEARWRKGKKPSSFLIAGVEMRDVPTAFEFREFQGDKASPPPVDGILGNDFLSHFEVTLDLPAGKVLLKPVKPSR